MGCLIRALGRRSRAPRRPSRGQLQRQTSALAVEQSTVSRRIAALETALGGALFDRTASGPRPTDLALRLMPQAERMEAELAELLDLSADSGGAGRVRGARVFLRRSGRGAPSSPELRRLHPDLRIDLVVDDRAADLGQREAGSPCGSFAPPTVITWPSASRACTAVLAHERYVVPPVSVEALDWVVFDLPGSITPDGAFLAAHIEHPAGDAYQQPPHCGSKRFRAGLGVALLVRALTTLDPTLVELPSSFRRSPGGALARRARSLAEVPRVRAVWDFLDARLAGSDQPEAELLRSARKL